MSRAGLAWVLVLVAGCGARTPLEPRASGDGGTLLDARSDFDAGLDAAFDATTDTARDASFDASFDAGFDAPSGDSCRRDRDCVSGRCRLDAALAPEDLTPAPLVCGDDLSGADDGAFCDDLGGCARGLCVVAGTCVAPCVADDDCQMGERCAALHVRTGPSALQTLNGCVTRFDLPAGVEAVREALGRRRGTTTVEVAGVRSRALYLYQSTGRPLIATRLETAGPGSELLFDLEAIGPGEPAPRNPVAPLLDPLPLLLPNSPTSVATLAGYTLALDVGPPAELEVSRLERTRGRGRVLDIDLFYVGGGRFAPRGERGPPAIRAALRELEEVLGIPVGEVRQHEVVGTLRRRLGVLEADIEGELPELGDLFALSAGAGRPALSIFLVRDMETALGISGGIPGPWGMHGLVGSGVAVSVDALSMLPPDFEVTLGVVMAHEVGHFLGLFHTTEIDGTVVEPLPMTPECPPENDVEGDGVLLPDECVGLGSDNLMFWAGSGTRLTRDQRQLIREAFLLR